MENPPAFIINCVSLASLSTSRDIFSLESLNINVCTYHCLYYYSTTIAYWQKRFTSFNARRSNKVYNMNVYIYHGMLLDKSVSKLDLQRQNFLEENMVNSFDDTCKHWYPKFCLELSIQLSFYFFLFPLWLQCCLVNTHLSWYLSERN